MKSRTDRAERLRGKPRCVRAPITTPHRGCRRRGLAPLELVLAIPFLLMVLAMIINLGTEVKWKIRTLAVSRQAVWRHRRDRSGDTDPPLAGWPRQGTSLRVFSASSQPIFPQDPLAPYTVVRGPALRNPQNSTAGSQLNVNTTLFDMTGSSGGADQANASIRRNFPLLPMLSDVHLSVDQLLVDDQWRFWEMGFLQNDSRRIRQLYTFVPPGAVTNLAQIFQQAASAVVTNPMRPNLFPLDHDEELAAWLGRPTDFHPRLQRVCSLNRFEVRAGPVQQLIDRIQGPTGGGRGRRNPPQSAVPEAMARAFLSMYQGQLQQLQNQNPPPQGQISTLEQKISQLQKFLGELR
jgi:hypothetical protein